MKTETPISKLNKKEYFKYQYIHEWLREKYGKASRCEGDGCTHKSNHFVYALKKGCEHERNRNNYIMLCQSCHAQYDLKQEWVDRLRRAQVESLKSIRKPIRQYNLNNELLNEFESMASAAKHLNRHPEGQTNISACVRGVTNTAYGYKWEYK